MVVFYLSQLKNVLVEGNPFARKDVAVTLGATVLVSACLTSYLDMFEATLKASPIQDFLLLVADLLVLGACYHVLGILLECPNQPEKLKERFARTGFVLTRSNWFLLLNFCLVAIPTVLLVNTVLESLSSQFGITEDSFAYVLAWMIGSIPVFGALAVFWFLFPRWFFNCMPFVYDKRDFSSDVKIRLRKMAVLTLFVLFFVDLVSTVFEYGVDTVFGDDSALEFLFSNLLLSVSSIGYLYLFVGAMTASARMAGLNSRMEVPVADTEVNTENIIHVASVSGKASAWKLFPYTDGSFVYYPGTRWNKGYVLTRPEAVELLHDLENKGISFAKLVIIGGVAGFLGSFAGFMPAGESILSSTWFFPLVWVGLLAIIFTEGWYKDKKFQRQYPEAPVCTHPFPGEYFRLRLLTYPFYSKGLLWFFSIFCSLLTVLFSVVMIFDGFENLNAGMMVPITALFVILAGFYWWLLFCRVTFGRIHGRKPTAEDLKPIDPVIGKMLISPFDPRQSE